MDLPDRNSVYQCSSETTLLHAKLMAAEAGISDVIDITDLDCIGVPVFASVRPQARADVHTFGKGLRRVDAEVGAYLEALEFFYAEPRNAAVATRWGTARDVAGSERADDAVLDFPPLLHREVDLGADMLLASVGNLETGEECWLPAELVHYPASDVGQSLYGATTNGLACGETLAGASAHGLLELIERDIWSFESVRQSSRLVDPETLPQQVREIVDRAERHGLTFRIRTIANAYELPFFAAFLFDGNDPRRATFNGGWACDLDRTSALVRAVTEAAQSRLAFIHGGRKVRPTRSPDGALETAEREAAVVRRHMAGVCDAAGQVGFDDVASAAMPDGVPARLSEVIARVRRVTDKPIYQAVLSPPTALLQVVRMVVPLLENFKPARARVGRRLKAALNAPSAGGV